MTWFSSEPSTTTPLALPCSRSEPTTFPSTDERSVYYAEPSQDTFELHAGDDGRDLLHRRSCRSVWREVTSMEGLANIISMLDYVLDSPRKRHITGGLLLSASMLFGSLALTVFTLKNDEITIEEEPEYGQEE